MAEKKSEFTKADLEKVALLSRLSLTENEKEKFLFEIKEILGFVSELESINAENVDSSGGINYGGQFLNSVNKNIMREDKILNEGGKYTEALLNNAPVRNGDYIEVSQVLDKHKKPASA
jgi:aspartyl-tRNA(Asn)/glutamyl-tRNA(Gln) amidotransferase subunit C